MLRGQPLLEGVVRRADNALELGSPLGVVRDDGAAPVVLDDLRLLGHSAFFPKFHVPANYRVVLDHPRAVGIVAPVLTCDIGVAGSRTGAQREDGPNLVARHQMRSPDRRSRATAASIPTRSMTLIPFALTRNL